MRFSVYYYVPLSGYGRADFCQLGRARGFAKRMRRRGFRVKIRRAESA